MKNVSKVILVFATSALVVFNSCSKDEDVPLPPIDGYNSSDEVAAANVVAYWSMDGTGNESKTTTAPTSSINATYVSGGVRGQALQLASGYLYYAGALGTLTTNQPFSLSAWIQVTNNKLDGGSPPANNFPLSYFQSTIPGQLFGNLTAMVEAGSYTAASDTMVVKSIYKDLNGGTQDNINNYSDPGTFKVVKKAGTGQWVNLITTYSPASAGTENIFRIYADTVLVSSTVYEKRGTNSFKYTPGEVIIGGWYNNIPGKTVSPDDWTQPFTGKIDEIRLYNKLLSSDEIKAIWNLGKAGR